MKQKLKIIMCLALSAIVYSCSEEKDIVKEQNSISTVNLKDLPFLQKELNKDKRKGSYSKESIVYYLDKINTKDIIQIIDQQGFKSYTFALNYREQDTLINLCAKETSEGYSYALLKYSTTNLDEWIEDIRNTQKSFINPEVKAEPLDSKMYLSPTTCIEFHYVCPSGLHDLGSIGECEYQNNRDLWYSAYEIVACNTGGGSQPPPTSGGSHGGGINNSGTTITTVPNVADDDENNETPCDKLKYKLDPAKANLKPAFQALQTTITATGGENATYFKKDNEGNYLPPVSVTPTQNNTINSPVGGFIYAYAHTHTEDLYSMFSWTDVNSLLDVLQNASPTNTSEVTIFLLAHDDFHANLVYALTINDIAAFTAMVNQKIGSVPIPAPFTQKERLKYLDNELGDKFASDNNLERDFLEHFADFNISLFKADTNLNTWSELKINSSPSPSLPSIVQPIPCNN